MRLSIGRSHLAVAILVCPLGWLVYPALTACNAISIVSEFDAGATDTDAGYSPPARDDFGFSDGGGVDAGGDASGESVGTLEAIVRDFRRYDAAAPLGSTSPDFENVPSDAERPDGAATGHVGPWSEALPAYLPNASYPINIVKAQLGIDGKPEYNILATFKGTLGRTATTHGASAFDAWYRDKGGLNVTRRLPLTLTKDGNGVYSYDSAVSGSLRDPNAPQSNTNRKGFFPIDDGTPNSTSADGFGNQGEKHNYHFTVELHTTFTYRGFETFKFSGDDDVFVFINKILVINLGGIHEVLTKEIKLPELAPNIGLELGKEYPLDFFQAERHVIDSNLRIDTTIELRPGSVR